MLGLFELGKDRMGICTCGMELPPLSGAGYGYETGRLLYAENGMQVMMAIMSTAAHDVIEYYHRGNNLWQEVRMRGGCPPLAAALEERAQV